jgi:hypothetical protein
LLLSLAAAPAALAAGRFLSPAAGDRLAAGARVEVRWEGLPPGIEEMELLVSWDGGREFARVADDLAPSSVSFSWPVPSLPCRAAVLALRGRIDGRETILFRTDPFAIDGVSGSGVQEVSYHGSELWTDSAGTPAPLPETGLTGATSWASAALSASDDLDDAPDSLDGNLPLASCPEVAGPARRPAAASGSLRSRSPLVFPLRN